MREEELEVRMGGLFFRAKSIESEDDFEVLYEKIEDLTELTSDHEGLYRLIYAAFRGIQDQERREEFFSRSPPYLDESIGEFVLDNYEENRKFCKTINRLIRNGKYP